MSPSFVGNSKMAGSFTSMILSYRRTFFFPRSEKWAVWGLENGLTTLTETLEAHLRRQGVEIFTQMDIKAVHARFDCF